jgi:hypothetical protein
VYYIAALMWYPGLTTVRVIFSVGIRGSLFFAARLSWFCAVVIFAMSRHPRAICMPSHPARDFGFCKKFANVDAQAAIPASGASTPRPMSRAGGSTTTKPPALDQYAAID